MAAGELLRPCSNGIHTVYWPEAADGIRPFAVRFGNDTHLRGIILRIKGMMEGHCHYGKSALRADGFQHSVYNGICTALHMADAGQRALHQYHISAANPTQFQTEANILFGNGTHMSIPFHQRRHRRSSITAIFAQRACTVNCHGNKPNIPDLL